MYDRLFSDLMDNCKINVFDAFEKINSFYDDITKNYVQAYIFSAKVIGYSITSFYTKPLACITYNYAALFWNKRSKLRCLRWRRISLPLSRKIAH